MAAAFIGALDAAPAGRAVLVELDSPGGFVKAGYAMIDAMLRHRAEALAAADANVVTELAAAAR